MYASIIGKKFLSYYNAENNVNLSPKEFFEKEYFEFFYNHAKYMQWVTNSPFVQMKKGQKPHLLSQDERLEKLQALYAKIDNGSQDASMAIGFPSEDEAKFKTGQVTNMTLPIDKDDVYCSWIGSGFGIGVKDGLCIFFEHPLILKALFDGWKIYRAYLNDSAYEKLKGNQINTWNGQWLSNAFGKDFDNEDPVNNFHPFETQKDGTIKVTTQIWVKILFAIAFKIQSGENLTGYVYSLGQTNKTIGFLPFRLPQIKKPLELYRKLFGENQFLNDSKKIEELYGNEYSFERSCQSGSIGIQALEPKGLKEFIPYGRKEAKMPDYTKANEDKRLTFNTYITWVLAMLNNEELWETAGKAADTFLKYEEGAERAKKDRINRVRAVLDASNRRQFIEGLTTIVKEADQISGLVELAETVNKMPVDNFLYFLTLIRFRYAEKSK